MSTIETAKESERGIADLETLKATNESLISTLDEVMNIQREGREKRREAEAELRNMENELKAKTSGNQRIKLFGLTAVFYQLEFHLITDVERE